MLREIFTSVKSINKKLIRRKPFPTYNKLILFKGKKKIPSILFTVKLLPSVVSKGAEPSFERMSINPSSFPAELNNKKSLPK